MASKKQAAATVYRVTEIIGTSTVSWEDAAKSAVETAAKSLRDLRVAEVGQLDMKVENGKVVAYRARVALSFKYQGGACTLSRSCRRRAPALVSAEMALRTLAGEAARAAARRSWSWPRAVPPSARASEARRGASRSPPGVRWGKGRARRWSARAAAVVRLS